VEVTSFVGREAELAQLARLLDTARLVTVTGPGGVGKTRLALRAAARSRYRDGVTLVDLSPERGPGLPAALAAALGGPAQADPPDTERRLSQPAPSGHCPDPVLRHLHDRRMLLILDTCEHVIESCAALALAVLARAAGVTILATSRQPLDVPGEHVMALHPLPVPEAGASGQDHGSALELFAQRAVSVVPDFTLTSHNRALVISLCQRLDGLPLALELAALRLRALPLRHLDELAGRPGAGYLSLTGSRRTMAPRQQSLARSIGWSHDLCTPAERTAWARLSAFGGSFTLAAAEAVCADADPAGPVLPAGQVARAVIGLVDKSVLVRAPAGASTGAGSTGGGSTGAAMADGEPASRYRLPWAVRQAGAGHLAATADAGTAVHARYVAHWTGVAERFADRIIDDQLSQYRAVHRERDNLRAAQEHALLLPDADRVAAPLAVALTMSWVISGNLREGRQRLDEVAGRGRRPSAAGARALAARAFLAAMAGDVPAALADAEASIAMAADTGDPVARGRGCVALHQAAAWSGDLARAARAAALGVPALEEAGDVLGLVQLDIQAGLACLPGDPQACAAACARGLLRLPPGELWATSRLLGLSALQLLQAGDHQAAGDPARRALAMSHQLGDAIGMAEGLSTLGFLAAAQGYFGRAAWLAGAAAPLRERVGLRDAGHPMLEDLRRLAVRTAIAALGGDKYARLRDAGAAQSLDEAIALAAGSRAEPELELPAVAGAARPLAGPDKPAAGLGRLARGSAGPLTGREIQIAALVASGMSNRQVAEQMTISKRTVDAHVDHIFSKLGISSRVQLTIWLRDRIPNAQTSQEQAERVL